MKHNNKNNNNNINKKMNTNKNTNKQKMYNKPPNYLLLGCLNHPGCAWSCMCDCKNCRIFEESLFENIRK